MEKQMSNPINRIMVPRGHSLATASIIELLEKGETSDVLTDEQISTVANKDCSVTGNGYSSLMSAIRWVISNNGIHWQRVKGSGAIKCVTSAETITAIEGNIRQVKKRMSRTIKLSACVDVNAIPQTDRPKFLAMVAQAGTIAQFASSNATKALEARNVKEPFDFTKTLRLASGQ